MSSWNGRRLPEEPIIPDETLRQRWEQDERLQEVHARAAAMTLDQLVEWMPETTYPDPDTRRVAYVDLSPEEDHDRESGIILPLQWTQRWLPRMAVQAWMLQNSLEVPTRIIALPNGKGSIDLDKAEAKKVTNGDFAPVAERQTKTVAGLGIERARYVGYSHGAVVGAAALRLVNLDIDRAVLMEPPNIMTRLSPQLRKDFAKGGFRVLNGAINDSAIPVLSEAQHSHGGLDAIPQLLSLAPMVFVDDADKAAREGYTHAFFRRDLLDGLTDNKGLQVFLASAEKSVVAPSEHMRSIVTEAKSFYGGRVQSHLVKNYGHEAGNNVVVHTLLAKMGLDNATYASAT